MASLAPLDVVRLRPSGVFLFPAFRDHDLLVVKELGRSFGGERWEVLVLFSDGIERLVDINDIEKCAS